MHKKFGSRKPFERSPQRKQWAVQRKNDSGDPFKTLDLRGDGKTGLADEGASANEEEPTVVDWGVLSEEPEEDLGVFTRKAPEQQLPENQHNPAKTELRVRDQRLFTKELEHLLTKCEQKQRMVERKRKKVERLMKSLVKMNEENWQFKTAKNGLAPDEATDGSESPPPSPSNLPSYEEALAKIEALVELRPCADQRDKQINAYMQLWSKQGPKLKEPEPLEEAALDLYQEQYKAEFERTQAELGVTPDSSERKEEIEAHMETWEKASRPKLWKERREARRFKELYAKELTKIQNKLKVTPGSEEHKDEIEAHMKRFEEKRRAVVEKVEERRQTKGKIAALKRSWKLARKREQKEAKEAKEANI